MKCYVCVYNQPVPDRRDLRKVVQISESRRHLKAFLEHYEARFGHRGERLVQLYDWGDDPSFFSATEFLDDVRSSSWGVCRPNVRTKLEVGDFVVFFCAQRSERRPPITRYYYVGVGTVGEVVADRRAIWKEPHLKGYRRFFNILTNRSGRHREYFRPKHKNWDELANTPYIIFDSDPTLTHFDVNHALLVAEYDSESQTPEFGPLESWRMADARVHSLDKILFQGNLKDSRNGKKLRTSPQRFGHVHLNLSDLSDRKLRQIRKSLLLISEKSA